MKFPVALDKHPIPYFFAYIYQVVSGMTKEVLVESDSRMRYLKPISKGCSQNRRSKVSTFSQLRRLRSLSHPVPCFGIAFDIDGVILRGHSPVGGSPQALSQLYHDSGILKVPYVFLTNGGGVPESRRASELSKQLGINIRPQQVIQGHSPFKQLVNRFEKELIVAVGKGEPADVMTEYGFKNVVSMDEYASCFDSIDPLAQYKNWRVDSQKSSSKTGISSQRVKAAFIVSDPIDWGRDIQVLCDILRTGGLPGTEIAHQPPLYFANDDIDYQAVFPSERLGMAAFRIALESIFNRIHPEPLKYTSFGKPKPFVFQNAEIVLRDLLHLLVDNLQNAKPGNFDNHCFKALYMIGDNPAIDINGARQAGQPWFSILTRTGVFKGKENHAEHPADLVVDTVEEAVDYILKRECML